MRAVCLVYENGLQRAGILVRVPILFTGMLFRFGFEREKNGTLRLLEKENRKPFRIPEFWKRVGIKAAPKVFGCIQILDADLSAAVGTGQADSTARVTGLLLALSSALFVAAPSAHREILPVFGENVFRLQVVCILRISLGKAIWDMICAIISVLGGSVRNAASD